MAEPYLVLLACLVGAVAVFALGMCWPATPAPAAQRVPRRSQVAETSEALAKLRAATPSLPAFAPYEAPPWPVWTVTYPAPEPSPAPAAPCRCPQVPARCQANTCPALCIAALGPCPGAPSP